MSQIKPHITEKSVMQAKTGRYTVEVGSNLTKGQIERIVKDVFSLKPLSISIIRKKAIEKKKAKGFATEKGLKKAIIRLADKQIFPGYEEFLKEPKAEKTEKQSKKAPKQEKVKDVETKVISKG